ncbi:MAG TPA: hypothetical protein PLK55_00615 [archaeon]|jgi:hypothetical protein|nr:hypothetical protein [archaeon]
MTEKIIEELSQIKFKATTIYESFKYPLHRTNKTQRIPLLKNIKNNIEELTRLLNGLLGYSSIQFNKEIEAEKIRLFQNVFLEISGKLQQSIFLEEHTTIVENDLVNIKNEIATPEKYFEIEQSVKNNINNLIIFIDDAKKQIDHKYVSLANQKRSVEELLKTLERKDQTILELNKRIDELNWIDAKEKAKTSRLANLEEELLKTYKANEQDLTILKLHIIHIEKALDNLLRESKSLTQDINHLEAKNILKEQASLELIKELKKELIAAKYNLKNK